MKRFAKLDGRAVVEVVEALQLPGADFVEVPDDTPCGPGYTFENGLFCPVAMPFGYGVGVGYPVGADRINGAPVVFEPNRPADVAVMGVPMAGGQNYMGIARMGSLATPSMESGNDHGVT
ncbi:hypothetical protein VOI32_15595 [Paraburkholderia caribensis]|uniref:Uncharacterized protein n=1 Tax=Paraburkholderia caribensis TaxID=75105 RepID=A0A9Q6WLI2_9BURK|nr:hypothetical protein [Paraburkholderia caribensis]MCO4875784.1 hypothetical protein [Paraburkholderia caribensis]PTB29696.1 hypothetical protein C9I56_07005 [Paraburkholderia caribensis]QLB62581.1 hypothetical protein A9O66_09425 [Paraburkholderia caribensis]